MKVGRGHVKLSNGSRLWLCACTVAAVTLLAACATAASSPVPSAAGGHRAQTYTNPFGFSITYDNSALRRFVGFANAVQERFGVTPDGPIYHAVKVGITGFAERGIKQIVEAPAMTVVAKEATTEITPPPLSALRSAQNLFWTGKPLPRTSMVRKAGRPMTIEPVTVHGLSGYRLSQRGGGWVHVLYALFDGRVVYLVNCNAKAAAWPTMGPILEAAARSLRVTSQGGGR
jgi:hypothetical protein